MKKIAGVDIGTNSIRLLAITTDHQNYSVFLKKLYTVRLGENLHFNKIFSSQKIHEALEILQEIILLCKKKCCDEIHFFGTHALRIAENNLELIDLFFRKTGYKINIVRGCEEAEYSYFGSVKSLNLNGNICVIDIGAGSTEICWSISNTQIKSFSISCGCLNMTEKYKFGEDSFFLEKRNQLKNFLKNQLNCYSQQFPDFSHFVGVGGTVTSLAAIHQNLKEYKSEMIHNYELSFNDVFVLYNKLTRLSIIERNDIKVLKDRRGEIIIAGIIILETVMEFFNCINLKVSDYGIILGYLLNKFEK